MGTNQNGSIQGQTSVRLINKIETDFEKTGIRPETDWEPTVIKLETTQIELETKLEQTRDTMGMCWD